MVVDPTAVPPRVARISRGEVMPHQRKGTTPLYYPWLRPTYDRGQFLFPFCGEMLLGYRLLGETQG